ncbi:metallophosphoesterase [Bacillus sp. 31A1R]|uniref:Metallophosphoesterase n=1 Tax=Robertmurraya mangrovi TaxID=3098077 RepID=A0ABU5ITX4_9BACI|nr:metallophosphoesterase [Bacillus sp. 31A1R]MDZ5470594.1 metallophosphoesterase [Bacillus sp. 31A1R]
MPKKVSRRVFLKKSFGTFLAAIGLTSGGYFYAKKIEPKLLQTSYENIIHKDIPTSFNQLKIVQFSDTHLGFHYDLNDLIHLVDKINTINPDIIFFTGDLMDEPNKYTQAESIIPILSSLKAPLGKFAVYGNHDHGGYGSDIYKTIINQSGFKLLFNSFEEIKLIDNERIYIAGIDDAMLGKPNIREIAEKIPENSYKILLSHAPDLADDAVNFGFQLQLSGHSHGGQIQIPFLGVLVKPPYAEKYYEGFYQIKGKQDLTLYVNRGLGTTRLPFRFLSRPELTVFTLNNGH